MMAKAQLRRSMTETLRSLRLDDLTRQGVGIQKHLIESIRFKAAKNVAVYLNMRREAPTDAIVKEIFQSGKVCWIPVVPRASAEPPKPMRFVQLKSQEHLDSFERNKWGIPEPPAGIEDDEVCLMERDDVYLDLVVVPGLAFDRQGRRLGRGKGYYDSFIDRITAKHKRLFGKGGPYLAALAFEEQLVEKVPCVDHDRHVHAIHHATATIESESPAHSVPPP